MTATVEIPKSAQALNHLMGIVCGYVTAQALITACNLGLFEALSQGPMSAPDLAPRVGIHPVACRRLLGMLAKLGLVTREGEQYRNSEVGAFCSSQSEVNLSAVAGFGNPFYHMFEYLPDALREYGPRWQQAVGATSADVFGAMYEDPARLRQFAQFMNALSIPQGQLIADCYDFTSHTCIMDVAGGPGGQAVQIGLKYPHLRGIISDMAPVCAIAAEYIQSCGVADRFTSVPADLFEGPYPDGADVIVLGHILHDWNDDHCRMILRHCAAALPALGTLLVSESVLEPDYSGSTFGLVKDLTMLVASESGSRERTETEYRSLLDEAGFDLTSMIRLDAPRDLIVAAKR